MVRMFPTSAQSQVRAVARLCSGSKRPGASALGALLGEEVLGTCRKNVLQLLRTNLHPYKGEEGNKNCIFKELECGAQPGIFLELSYLGNLRAGGLSWLKTLSFSCLTDLSLWKYEFLSSSSLAWSQVGHERLLVPQPPYFLGLCLHNTCY